MIFIKPSGLEIEVNVREGTVEYCKSLGWEEKGAEKEVKKEVKKKTSKKNK